MSQINITNSTITYKHQVIKTANISSIDLKESIVKNNIAVIIIGILSCLGGVRVSLQLNTAFYGIISIVFGCLCFWYNRKQKKDSHTYFLLIQTNAGREQLFHNPDYNFINGIRLKIQEAMDAYAQPINVTYNLDNKTVFNNPTGSISITNVTRYEALSDDQRSFIKNSFEPALLRIQKEISKTNNEEIRRNFEMMKQELKSSKPRKSILEAAWTAFQNIGSLSELAGTIEKGINMF